MQGLFGARVNELYLWIKALMNIERTVDLGLKNNNNNNTHVYIGTVSQAWRGQTLIPCNSIQDELSDNYDTVSAPE